MRRLHGRSRPARLTGCEIAQGEWDSANAGLEGSAPFSDTEDLAAQSKIIKKISHNLA